MQPIVNRTTEDDDTTDVEPRRLPRAPTVSSNFYPLTVFFWVIGVATVCVIVGLICSEFFADYVAILRNLISG